MKWIVLLAIYVFGLARFVKAGRWNELALSASVLAVLAIFLAVAASMRQSPIGRDIAVRTKTWCWMVGVFLLASSLHEAVTYALLTLISFVALREYFSLLPMYHRGTFLRAEDRVAIALAYLMVPAVYALAYSGWYGLYIVLVPVFATLVLPIALVMGNNPRGVLISMGAILVGLYLFVYLFSHAALLAGLEPFLLFYALLVTELRDVLAYCFGKLLAPLKAPWLHVPVAAEINPRKTWVGSALAALGCAAASAAMWPLMPVLDGGKPSVAFLLWIGFLVGWLGLAGDLATGAIKRDLEVKDTGHSLPGHGGVIDRINGVIFTVPVILHLIWYTYYEGTFRI
jgi:phosphatidate cytidylyltransferase